MSEIPLPAAESFVFPNGTFVENSRAAFAAGLISVDSVPVEDRVFEHYAVQRLRGATYVKEGFLSPGDLGVDLTEIDDNDSRSAGFAVLENMGTFAGHSLQRVVGTMRYIEKRTDDDTPLPVEEFYPEVFDAPLPAGAIEISRYIINYANQNDVRAHIRRELFGVVLSSIAVRGLGPTYAVVDKGLARLLRHPSVGTPLEQVGDEKFVPHYNSKNVAIMIDTAAMAKGYGVVPGVDSGHDTRYVYSEPEMSALTS